MSAVRECKTCGEPSYPAGTLTCEDCWVVERRINRYLSAPKARERVRRLLVQWGTVKEAS